MTLEVVRAEVPRKDQIALHARRPPVLELLPQFVRRRHPVKRIGEGLNEHPVSRHTGFVEQTDRLVDVRHDATAGMRAGETLATEDIDGADVRSEGVAG